MTLSLLVRSALALLASVAIAGLALTHAAVPPASALRAELSNRGDGGPVVQVLPPEPVLPSWRWPNGRSQATPITRAQPGVVIHPGFDISDFPNVAGHIFFDGTDRNIRFVTGRHARRLFTGDGSSVAPALSPDGRSVAWVELQRNYSDIYVTTLAYRRDGTVVAMTTTQLTQDQSPPPALETSPAPAGVYDPRYQWWATKPAWLPDGRHLLYLSDRPGFDPNNQENATMSVWEQGLDAPITNAVRLTVPAPGTGGHDSAAWRPHDPTTFLYVNYYQNSVTLPGGEGVIMAASVPTTTTPAPDTIRAKGLTPHGATEYQPAWSPDGHYIAFVEDEGHTRSKLLVMPFRAPGWPLDYYRAVTVAKGHPWIVQPFWSPDGHYLGYLSSTGGDFALVIRRAYLDGRKPHFGPPISIPQAGAVSADYRPTWGP
jgi:dipeptidyl aminopeptidase/acylaminoacyl peptidase